MAAAELLEAAQGLDPPPVSSAVCDSRIHVDLVGAGELPQAFVIVSVARAAHMTRDEFTWYYRTQHVPAAMAVDPLFVRYSTHRVLHAYGDFAQDVITVQEYPSPADVDLHIRKRLEATQGASGQGGLFSKVDYYSGDRTLL